MIDPVGPRGEPEETFSCDLQVGYWVALTEGPDDASHVDLGLNESLGLQFSAASLE
jgi:hypothetical protein